MDYYLKGDIISETYIKTDSGYFTYSGNTLTINNNPSNTFLLEKNKGNYGIRLSTNVALYLQPDGTFSGVKSYFSVLPLNFNVDRPVAGEFYSIRDYLGKPVSFADKIKFIQKKWYQMGKCNIRTDNIESQWEANKTNFVTKGFTNKHDCKQNYFYPYCSKKKQCGDCYGTCELGSKCHDIGDKKFKCGIAGFVKEREFPLLYIGIVLSLIIFVIFFAYGSM